MILQLILTTTKASYWTTIQQCLRERGLFYLNFFSSEAFVHPCKWIHKKCIFSTFSPSKQSPQSWQVNFTFSYLPHNSFFLPPISGWLLFSRWYLSEEAWTFRSLFTSVYHSTICMALVENVSHEYGTLEKQILSLQDSYQQWRRETHL